jgi:hypothetical protein
MLQPTERRPLSHFFWRIPTSSEVGGRCYSLQSATAITFLLRIRTSSEVGG